MLLYGAIGEKIDGDYFAQELNWLGREYDEIVIRINSMGGDMHQGLSIVSEMRASNAFIVTVVEGVAASMAGVIALAGDERRMNDYARIMLHLAYYVDNDGNKITKLSKKDHKALDQMNGILTDILGRIGKDAEAIKTLLDAETWYDAETAQTEGLISKIIDTTRKELAALEPLKLVAKMNEELTFNNLKSMKKLAAKFGLGEDATEEQILEKMQEAETKAANDAVERLLTIGKALGTVTDENREKAKRLAKADFDLAAEMFLTPKDEKAGEKKEEKEDGEKNITIAELLKAVKGESKTEAKKFEDLSEDELETMREKEPKAYAALFKARYGYEPELEN